MKSILLFRFFCRCLPQTKFFNENNVDPTTTIIFPWVVQSLGVCVFFVLTRFDVLLPYAAVMFLMGTIMGAAASARSSNSSESMDQLSTSILQWSEINSSLLLLVFLPGLIFRDAIEVNFNLFVKSLSQLILLAFPMVFMGTILTAVVGHYVLIAYDFPFSLAATLGAILSSTDPVAVSSVMKKAGAPPRLQMHISGESMLNDGAAVVFYTIFSQQYLHSVGLLDESTSVGEGFATFFRMAGGGVAVGLAFATGLLAMLHELDRRLEPEFNVLQVVVALTAAYLSYYVSEQVCQMSGVIACVVCGITARALGRGMITDNQMMDSYLALMEYLLNTLLFSLGGVVWGRVIADSGSTGFISWIDVLYLVALYVLVLAIRFFQVAVFYPIFSHIGLGSNWKEAAFLGYGGMRGAVSVALALSLSRAAREATDNPEMLRRTESLEFLAGGVALLSLVVNGSTAGAVLRWLGLAKPIISRKRAVRIFRTSAESFVLKEYKKLLLEKRWSKTNFAVVKDHVPFVTAEPIITVSPSELSQRVSGNSREEECKMHFSKMLNSTEQTCPGHYLLEMRHIFLELLNEAYSMELSNGELDEREDNGMTIDLLKQSVEFALSDVERDDTIHDFQYTQNYNLFEDAKSLALRNFRLRKRGRAKGKYCTYRFQQRRVAVLRALAFIEAHHMVEKKLVAYVDSFAMSSSEENITSVHVTNAVKTVLKESAQQVEAAEKVLAQIPQEEVKLITSLAVCTILLHRVAKFVEKSAADGVLTKNEAREHLDRIDRSLQAARTCDRDIPSSTIKDVDQALGDIRIPMMEKGEISSTNFDVDESRESSIISSSE